MICERANLLMRAPGIRRDPYDSDLRPSHIDNSSSWTKNNFQWSKKRRV